MQTFDNFRGGIFLPLINNRSEADRKYGERERGMTSSKRPQSDSTQTCSFHGAGIGHEATMILRFVFTDLTVSS